MVGFAGVNVTEDSVALVTVNVALPETLPEVAVIVTVPAVRPLTRPLVPAELLIVAFAVSDELQLTVDVRT